MKKFIKRFTRKQGGFTLIELLVVIAILGILAAIIVPSVSRYIGSGQTAANETEYSLVQNAVGAAMADAHVGTLVTSGTGQNVDTLTVSKATTDNPAITGPTGKIAHVADYFNGQKLEDLVGKYTLKTTGEIDTATYP